jgi:hypothetical protein
MSLSDRLLSALRVGVAALVAFALTYLAEHLHVVISAHTGALVQAFVLAAVASVYHQVASWVQRRWPAWTVKFPALRWGAWLVALLLGTSKQPVVMERPAAPIDPTPAPTPAPVDPTPAPAPTPPAEQ